MAFSIQLFFSRFYRFYPVFPIVLYCLMRAIASYVIVDSFATVTEAKLRASVYVPWVIALLVGCGEVWWYEKANWAASTMKIARMVGRFLLIAFWLICVEISFFACMIEAIDCIYISYDRAVLFFIWCLFLVVAAIGVPIVACFFALKEDANELGKCSCTGLMCVAKCLFPHWGMIAFLIPLWIISNGYVRGTITKEHYLNIAWVIGLVVGNVECFLMNKKHMGDFAEPMKKWMWLGLHILVVFLYSLGLFAVPLADWASSDPNWTNWLRVVFLILNAVAFPFVFHKFLPVKDDSSATAPPAEPAAEPAPTA